jgi:hypothetical protein
MDLKVLPEPVHNYFPAPAEIQGIDPVLEGKN